MELVEEEQYRMWPGISPTSSVLLTTMLFITSQPPQVSRLFTKITELVEEEDSLVFVLIDEVESLTSARKVRMACMPYSTCSSSTSVRQRRCASAVGLRPSS